jgi:hypothetical protein
MNWQDQPFFLLFRAASKRYYCDAVAALYALGHPLSLEHGMAINTKRVIIAGLAAGVVMAICDFVLNGMVVADRMTAELNAFKPGMGDAMNQMDTNTMIGFVIMDIVLGMLLAYTYAAMRPRFGAGAKTSIIVALVLWIFAGIISASYLIMGIMSQGLWWTVAIGYLVCLVIASLVAGALYQEDTAAA